MVWNSLVIAWMLAACGILGLALYRKLVSHNGEDDMIHLRDIDRGLVKQQVVVAQRLDVVDKWGKALTIALFVWGIALGAAFVYSKWLESLQPAF